MVGDFFVFRKPARQLGGYFLYEGFRQYQLKGPDAGVRYGYPSRYAWRDISLGPPLNDVTRQLPSGKKTEEKDRYKGPGQSSAMKYERADG